MASTNSTGYPQYMFQREQPSSSGQHFTAADGCKLVMNDGSLLQLDSGAQVTEAVVAHTSLTLALAHTGISTITAATSKIAFTLAAPVAGLTKTIVPLTTRVMYVNASTGITVTVGSSGKFGFTVELLAGGKVAGGAFVLKSLSTVAWTAVAVPSTIDLKLTQTTAYI